MSRRHGELYGDAIRRRSPKISAATPPPGGRKATDRQTAVFRNPRIQSPGDGYNGFLSEPMALAMRRTLPFEQRVTGQPGKEK